MQVRRLSHNQNMPVRLDSEDSETKALLDFVGSFAGKRVLEIGCGDGRLTWRYAKHAARVVAIDPDEDEIRVALEDRPHDVRVEFRAVGIEDFDAPDSVFDTAILSWTL